MTCAAILTLCQSASQILHFAPILHLSVAGRNTDYTLSWLAAVNKLCWGHLCPHFWMQSQLYLELFIISQDVFKQSTNKLLILMTSFLSDSFGLIIHRRVQICVRVSFWYCFLASKCHSQWQPQPRLRWRTDTQARLAWLVSGWKVVRDGGDVRVWGGWGRVVRVQHHSLSRVGIQM